jgi:5,10-methylenetetrahydrofolate reductase
MAPAKIIDRINEKIKRGETFFSFEFFPPRTEEVRLCAGPPGCFL